VQELIYKGTSTCYQIDIFLRRTGFDTKSGSKKQI